MLAFYLCIAQQGNAQITFNKSFDGLNNLIWGWTILPKDTNVVVIGGTWRNLQNYGYAYTQFSLTGQMEINKSYERDSSDIYISLNGNAKIDNHGAVINGGSISYTNLVDKSDAMLIKFKPDGDTLFVKYYGDTLWFETIYNTIVTRSGDYMLIGARNISGLPPDVYLIRTDSLGNLKWVKNYGINIDYAEMSNSIVEYAHEQFMIFTGRRKVNTNGYVPWVIKIDSAGNQIDEYLWSEAKYKCGGIRATPSLNQSEFIFIACWDTLFPNVVNQEPYPQVIGIMDTNYQFKWQKCFPIDVNSEFAIAKQMRDSTIIVIGQWGWADSGWILCLTQTGDLKWEHKYHYKGSKNNYFADFIQLPDGGYMLTGSTHNPTETQDLWLVRLDSLGRLTPDSTVNTGTWEVKVGEWQLALFPNPASNATQMAIYSPEQCNDCSVTIYDLEGRNIYSQSISIEKEIGKVVPVSTNQWPSGIYFVKLKAHETVVAYKKLVIE
jgi:hypothetical protein